MSRWLRDPLLHFLLLGVALFGLYSWLGRGGEAPTGEVVIGAAEIEALAASWERQWRRPPTPAELERLVDEEVRRELLYREALALGLDRDDPVVRRRLIDKMEFLSAEMGGASPVGEPDEGELERFFEAHRERYRMPPRVSFSHVFFDSGRRDDPAADARRALAELRTRPVPPPRAPELGDPFPLQTDYPSKTPEQIARHFGPVFADAVLALPEEGWAGPLESSYGVHLVYRGERRDGRPLELAEVRERLAADYHEAERRRAAERLFDELRGRYRVIVDREALAASGAAGRAPAEGER